MAQPEPVASGTGMVLGGNVDAYGNAVEVSLVNGDGGGIAEIALNINAM